MSAVERSPGGSLKQRRFPRLKRRVNCEVSAEGQNHVGVVLDLSPGGFFVQTAATPPIGSIVIVHLRSAAHDGVEVPARVANRRTAPSRFRSVAKGGIGCAVTSNPVRNFSVTVELCLPWRRKAIPHECSI